MLRSGLKTGKIIICTLIAVITISSFVYASDTSKTTESSSTDTKSKISEVNSTTKNDVNKEAKFVTYPKGTYHISKDGSGDFTSIASAAVLVPSGSTLILHEGIYNEAVSIQTKQINMKGLSKDKCIIQYDTANYALVPLNIASGYYENLTIKGYHKNNKLAAFPGYAIHIDCDSLANQAVVFNNCNIISENAFCVGIGLRKGAKITFKGCNFSTKKQGIALFHDSQNASLAGTASLSFENCVINNPCENLIVTQCISPASKTNLTFKNNTVIGNGDGFCLAYGSYAGDGSGWMGANNVFLTKNSEGNNIMSFNYKEMAEYRAQMAEKSAQLATLNAQNIAPNGKKKIEKFYTKIDDQGREINVPAEYDDGYIMYEDGSIEQFHPEGLVY